MRILNSIWFTPLGVIKPIGIVYGKDEVTGKEKAYIGNGNGVVESADELHINMNGAKFPVDAAKILFGKGGE